MIDDLSQPLQSLRGFVPASMQLEIPYQRHFFALYFPGASEAKKCQFSMGWNPFWAWLCGGLDRSNAIKELMNCVLQRFSEDHALNQSVAEEKGE